MASREKFGGRAAVILALAESVIGRSSGANCRAAIGQLFPLVYFLVRYVAPIGILALILASIL